MSTQTLPKPTERRADSDDLIHLYCCIPDVAICGETLQGEFLDDEVPAECVVCLDLDEADVSCKARFCRLRSRWRTRRWLL